MTNDNVKNTKRLQELSGSDYEIVDGQPDIRGWDIKNEQGQTIGEVDELIFDTQSRKVRYIVLDTDDNDLNLDDRKVLVPIGLAQLHEKNDDVILPSQTAAQLASLPEYKKGEDITSELETSVRNAFAGIGTATGVAAGSVLAGTSGKNDDDDFYNHEHFNEDNLYKNRRQATSRETDDTKTIPVIKEDLEIGKREVETGGVRVSSKITERPVEETINLKKERVTVERTPVDRPASEADLRNVTDKEIELTETSEVPVVAKEARVVEEVSVNKDVEEREETVRDTVRSTEVDVEKLDADQEALKRRNKD
jgi:uncharacterized protein (TIGR02271 family)